MIYKEPLMMIRRLAVFRLGMTAYDHTFHEGLNIIRGTNSSGKSTILDFIFYSLGGDFVGWKPEAESCQAVMIELEINQNIVTLRRGVSTNRAQPMEIFWGDMEAAKKSPYEGWEIHPFRRTDNKESFSQVLFRGLGMPEVRSELTSNITIHQLLRLICVDQLSNVNSLLRDEQWDSATVRRTIGDLLYGIFDDDLYQNELNLREAQRALESFKTEYSSLRVVIQEMGQPLDVALVDEQIAEVEAQLIKLREAILRGGESFGDEYAPSESERLGRLNNELVEIKRSYASASSEANRYSIEVADSEAFVESLEKRLKALGDAISAEIALGEIALNICPECLQLLPHRHEEGQCGLCGQQSPPEGRVRHLARIKNELATQIHESKKLLEIKSQNFRASSGEAMEQMGLLRIRENEFEDLINRNRSRRDAAFDEILEAKGAAEERLDALGNQKKLAMRLAEAERQITVLSYKIEVLQKNIRDGRSKQDARKLEVENAIEKYARIFLHNDLEREELFSVANDIKIDFERNLCLVDGRSSFSASSISYLKASVHFSILFASLDVDFMRYPKIIINDNIEDKGMEKERSQNLQKLVADLSSRSEVKHQIIMATSMIHPDLEVEEYCIGPSYTRENKTLRLS